MFSSSCFVLNPCTCILITSRCSLVVRDTRARGQDLRLPEQWESWLLSSRDCYWPEYVLPMLIFRLGAIDNNVIYCSFLVVPTLRFVVTIYIPVWTCKERSPAPLVVSSRSVDNDLHLVLTQHSVCGAVDMVLNKFSPPPLFSGRRCCNAENKQRNVV